MPKLPSFQLSNRQSCCGVRSGLGHPCIAAPENVGHEVLGFVLPLGVDQHWKWTQQDYQMFHAQKTIFTLGISSQQSKAENIPEGSSKPRGVLSKNQIFLAIVNIVSKLNSEPIEERGKILQSHLWDTGVCPYLLEFWTILFGVFIIDEAKRRKFNKTTCNCI